VILKRNIPSKHSAELIQCHWYNCLSQSERLAGDLVLDCMVFFLSIILPARCNGRYNGRYNAAGAASRHKGRGQKYMEIITINEVNAIAGLPRLKPSSAGSEQRKAGNWKRAAAPVRNRRWPTATGGALPDY
jgi:hypothetical protein